MDQTIYQADEVFGTLLKEKYPLVLKGYQFWARPIVKQMQESKNFTRFIYRIAKPWTHEMAHMMDRKEKGDLVGKIMMSVGFLMCWLIGVILINPIEFGILLVILISTLIYIRVKKDKGEIKSSNN